MSNLFKYLFGKKVLGGWNLIRSLRLVLGAMVVGQAIALREWPLVAAGGLLMILAIANVGCCGGNSCPAPRATKRSDS